MWLACLLGTLVAVLTTGIPGEAHWADLAVAEIVVEDTKTQITLVFPTGLVASADDNRDGQLSADEVRANRKVLETLLGERIRLSDGERPGVLGVLAVESTVMLPSNLDVAPGSHSTLMLAYTWPKPIRQLTIRYDLFLPGVSTASCLATIVQAGRVRTFVFTPTNRDFSFSLGDDTAWSRARRLLAGGIVNIRTGNAGLVLLVGVLLLAWGMGYLLVRALGRSSEV